MSQPFEDEEMMEILESFLVETNELLEILTTSLIEMENNPTDTEVINKIFRYFHTIKGTSSFMGFNDISKLTHAAEEILNKVRRNELSVSQNIIDVLMDSRDRLDLMTQAITNPGEPITYNDLVKRLEALSKGDNIDEVVENNETITSKSDADLSDDTYLDKVLNNTEMFTGHGDFDPDELELLEKAFAEVNNSFWSTNSDGSQILKNEISNNATSDIEVNNLSEIVEISTDATDKLQASIKEPIEIPELESSDKPQPEQINNVAASGQSISKNAPKPLSQTETIRIDVKRVESLMDLSGELVLGRNRLSQIASRVSGATDFKEILQDLLETTNQIDLITSEIQTSVMKMRMVPIGRLFQKAPKIVRDLSKEFGKKIELTLEGEDTEVDRGIIEELNDPLVHMLRNSCDHGIETSEERKSTGKKPAGQIKLTAYHEGNHIILKIIDDGKGIDPNVILKKAIEKEFITAEQSKHMTDWEILQLIFKPGFSTAKTVTSVSGRGVGMDVVKTNINKLKGIIEINSTPGQGSEFVVKLPLTLAIIQGLLVKSSGNIYALPLSSVVEVVSYDESSVSYVNNSKVIRIRSEVIPLITLDDITGDPDIHEIGSKYVVNLAIGIDRVGLVVNKLLGQQEIVIKSLGNYLTNIEGIAGSTIIGDGRVIMILDTQGIIKKYKKHQHNG